ncbi:hypothetical protein IFM46972_02027 [Aspergillus udagawae]|uniref:Uncharacterized protein n=1 Tax=Aspergillus udagawae TaxID=91492 RepID=A0A8H3NDA3_9EURO|nr:hypothetical protein IFM46972_02027 [Aspergillus udagawae]
MSIETTCPSLLNACQRQYVSASLVSTDTRWWMGAVEPAVSVAIDSVVGSQVGLAAVNVRTETELAVLSAAKDASAHAEAYF